MGYLFQNLYFDRYCVILQPFLDCLRNLVNIIRFAPSSVSLRVITATQAEQFNLVPRKKPSLQCCVSLFKNKEPKECSSDSVYQNDVQAMIMKQ